jgi:hypothetical protein
MKVWAVRMDLQIDCSVSPGAAMTADFELLADLNLHALFEFIEPVLKAGEGCKVYGLDIREVGAGDLTGQ